MKGLCGCWWCCQAGVFDIGCVCRMVVCSNVVCMKLSVVTVGSTSSECAG